ncbi:putative muscarinic acetylcholine receptor gar-2 [Hypsibius exemplaris]|uniref:Muscarinic acetylcholine receptor gar-2 n=1 Tax=Hypsibius exemplaris TaxID=2072580 RepID=A0A1W0WBQ3_HYPEX|nr:putative muscarinic acetylcholine receptor gar-2 [Hypsibius exemplaris]
MNGTTTTGLVRAPSSPSSYLINSTSATAVIPFPMDLFNYTTLAPYLLHQAAAATVGSISNCTLFNGSSCAGNETDLWHTTDPAKSKYATWEVVIIVALAAITAVVTVLGNILVLIAFAVERTLRQPSNYFIASLAVTDLLIGVFSMPAYSTYLVLERWPMPNILCDLWLSLDYTVCLVSQYNVLLITVDRFCSVKIPAKYRNWRAKRKVQIMVIATWIIPSSIFFPIHLGWDTFVGGRGMSEGSCDAQYIKSNPTFNVVLIFSYFWSTLVVLLILYAGIYQTAFSLQRKSQAKHQKMQQMVRLGATGVNKVIDTHKPAGFLTVHTLKAQSANNTNNSNNAVVNNDVSVAFHSTTVTQGGRTTADTTLEATTPKTATGTTATTTTGDNSTSSGDPDRSSSPEFPSDTEQATGDGTTAPLTKGTKRTAANNLLKKPPVKGGNTGRSPNFVFRDIRQRVTQRQQRPRGKTEMIVPKIQPPPPSKARTDLLPRRNPPPPTNPNNKAPTAKPDLIDLTPESPNMPSRRDSNSRSLPEVNKTATQIARGSFVLPCISQPMINTTTALQTILLAKELNDEIRLLFAQRGNSTTDTATTTTASAFRAVDNSASPSVDFSPVTTASGTAEPVWLPRVPFPVRFDELPSVLLQPFTGRTPLDNSNDWRYIDQESLKSPNSSMDGTQVTTTPTNRSSFSSPLPPIKSLTPQLSLRTPPVSPLSAVPENDPPAPSASSSSPTMLRPAKAPPPRVSVKPEVSDIGEESTRYDSDQRSANAHDQDNAVMMGNSTGALLDNRNNSERIRAFGRRLRNAASRGNSRKKSFTKRQQSRSENRARKALKTITFIMGAFVLCWTPWHICATIEGFCNGCVNPDFYALSYWLCYLNSPINPFCYALANQQFKKTFIRVLKFDFHRT